MHRWNVLATIEVPTHLRVDSGTCAHEGTARYSSELDAGGADPREEGRFEKCMAAFSFVRSPCYHCHVDVVRIRVHVGWVG
jgi:hypothetical protein